MDPSVPREESQGIKIKMTLTKVVGWFIGFYGISTIEDYLMPNLFLSNSSISNNSV